LLVGRQIVDRAKIQRIIFEFDYYEKAFHQFYDTYRVVPGNMGEQEAKKYGEFQKLIEYTKKTKECGFFDVGKSANNRALIQTHLYGSYVTAMCTLLSYIDNENFVSQLNGRHKDCKHSKDNGLKETKSCSNPTDLDGTTFAQSRSATASFDDRVFINFIGFTNKRSDGNPVMCVFPNAGQMSNMKNAPEETNKTWFRSSYNHNAIFMFRIVSAQVTRDSNNQGALSAAMTSELDAKIDDGRPATGKILAAKSGWARRTSATDDEIKAACYDKLVPDVDKAIYHSSKDLKYGCNIIKVMEDVK